MSKLFGVHWKTSLLGLMSGCGLILQDFMERGVTDIYRILVAICVYLLGRFAADNSKNEVK
jgi:hypothetical protein